MFLIARSPGYAADSPPSLAMKPIPGGHKSRPNKGRRPQRRPGFGHGKASGSGSGGVKKIEKGASAEDSKNSESSKRSGRRRKRIAIASAALGVGAALAGGAYYYISRARKMQTIEAEDRDFWETERARSAEERRRDQRISVFQWPR